MKRVALTILFCLAGVASLVAANALGEPASGATPGPFRAVSAARATRGPAPERLLAIARSCLARQEPAWQERKHFSTEIRNQGTHWTVTFLSSNPNASDSAVVLVHEKTLRAERARHFPAS